jgi:hypothetical protein
MMMHGLANPKPKVTLSKGHIHFFCFHFVKQNKKYDALIIHEDECAL